MLTYPLCKRFTWVTHFVLGAVDGLAPLGAYIGVAGTVTLPGALALRRGDDMGRGLRHHLRADGSRASTARRESVRCRRASAKRAAACLPIVLHGVMLVLLAAAGMLAGAGRTYFLGVLAVAALILYEEYLFRSGANLFVINERVFVSNMTFSVFFLLTTLGGFV